jgi:3-deoxy-D-manno-octulosonic-acid transferase
LGNIKFDKPAVTIREEDKQDLRKKLGISSDTTKIIVIGSTHETEEQAVLSAFRKVLGDHEDALLILAPRHIKRKDAIIPLIEKARLTWRCWSNMNGQKPQVVLVDTMGDLESFYSIAHVVFIAGSLAPIGGHNLIEPALLEKPILFGPHMKNFQEIAKLFLSRQAAIQVQDADELADKIRMLLADEDACARLSREARRLALANQGAGRKTVEAIQASLMGKAD